MTARRATSATTWCGSERSSRSCATSISAIRWAGVAPGRSRGRDAATSRYRSANRDEFPGGARQERLRHEGLLPAQATCLVTDGEQHLDGAIGAAVREVRPGEVDRDLDPLRRRADLGERIEQRHGCVRGPSRDLEAPRGAPGAAAAGPSMATRRGRGQGSGRLPAGLRSVQRGRRPPPGPGHAPRCRAARRPADGRPHPRCRRLVPGALPRPARARDGARTAPVARTRPNASPDAGRPGRCPGRRPPRAPGRQPRSRRLACPGRRPMRLR